MGVAAYARLSRLPFLVPGLAPFTAGLMLGAARGWSADSVLVALAYAGLALIMLATYYSNEYWDYEGDVLNRGFNRFSGGSRALSDGLLPREAGLRALVGAITVFAVLFSAYAALYFWSRPLLAVMAGVGLLLGVFYSAPPLRWAYRGFGEAAIWFAYGPLALLSGYYVATGGLSLEAFLLSLPAAFTVFSVILINEFPDLEADAAVGKSNLVVRLGREKASLLYAASNISAAFSALASGFVVGGFAGLAASMALVFLPSLALARLVAGGAYRSPATLERICGATVLLNAVSAFPPLLGLLW